MYLCECARRADLTWFPYPPNIPVIIKLISQVSTSSYKTPSLWWVSNKKYDNDNRSCDIIELPWWSLPRWRECRSKRCVHTSFQEKKFPAHPSTPLPSLTVLLCFPKDWRHVGDMGQSRPKVLCCPVCDFRKVSETLCSLFSHSLSRPWLNTQLTLGQWRRDSGRDGFFPTSSVTEHGFDPSVC